MLSPKTSKSITMGAPPKRPISKIPSIFKWELHIKFQVSQMGTPYQKSKYREWELHIKSITTGNSISKFQVSQMGTPYQNSKYHKWELHIKSLSITNGNSISRVSQMGIPYKNPRYHKWEFHIKIPGITNGNSISKFQVSQMGTPYQNSKYHKCQEYLIIPSSPLGTQLGAGHAQDPFEETFIRWRPASQWVGEVSTAYPFFLYFFKSSLVRFGARLMRIGANYCAL